MQVCGDNRQLPLLMGIGGGRQLAQAQERRLQPMSARGANLYHQSRNARTQLPEKILRGRHSLPQPFAQALRAVAAHAGGFVVVYLDILKAVIRQRRDYFLGQVVPHPGVAQIPEAAEARGDRHAVALELVGLEGEGVGFPPADLRLKPQPGAHARRPYGPGRALQPLGELPRVDPPVPHVHLPASSRLGVPAAVDDEAVDVPVPENRQRRLRPRLGRATPGSAKLVEHHRQALRSRQRIQGAPLHVRQPVAELVQRAGAGRQARHGRRKGFARMNVLRPVPEVVVRQPAGEAEAVILSVDLDLPGGRGMQLDAPDDAVGPVLHGGEGEPAAHRQRAHLTELLACHAVPGPGRLQLKILHRLADQTPLAAPPAAQPVEHKAVRRVARRVGRQAADAEAGEHFQRRRRIAPVEEHGLRLDAPRPLIMRQTMLHREAARRFQDGDDPGFFRIPAHVLPPEFKAIRGRAVSQGVAVGEAERKIVAPQPKLNQRFSVLVLRLPARLPARRIDLKGNDLSLRPKPIARLHIPEAFPEQQLLHRDSSPRSVLHAKHSSVYYRHEKPYCQKKY